MDAEASQIDADAMPLSPARQDSLAHFTRRAKTQQDEMIAKATSLNIAPSDVGKRIILKRMFGEVQEVKELTKLKPLLD